MVSIFSTVSKNRNYYGHGSNFARPQLRGMFCRIPRVGGGGGRQNSHIPGTRAVPLSGGTFSNSFQILGNTFQAKFNFRKFSHPYVLPRAI